MVTNIHPPMPRFFTETYQFSQYRKLNLIHGNQHSQYPKEYGLVVKVLDSQSRGPTFKTTEWLQGQHSFLSFQGRSVEYQKLLGDEW